jgi:hypothetical protein
VLALFLLVIATSLNASLEVLDRASKHAATATKTTPDRDGFAAWMLPSSTTEVETKDSLSKSSQVPTENVADDGSALPKPIAAPQVAPDENALLGFRPGKVAVIAAFVHGREVVAKPAHNHTKELAAGSAVEESTEKASSDDLSSAASALSPSSKADTASEVDTSKKSDDVADVVLVGRTELAQIGETPAGAVAHGEGNPNDIQPKPGDNEHSLPSRTLTKHLLHRPSATPDLTTSSAKSAMVASQDPLVPVAQHAESSAPRVPSPVVDVLPRTSEAGISTSRPASKQSVQIELSRQPETTARPAAVVGNDPVDELEPISLSLPSKDVAVGQHGLTSAHEITAQGSTVHSSTDVTFAYSFRNQAHITQDENEDKIVPERIGAAVESTGSIKGSQPVQRLDVSVDDPVLGNIGLRAEIRGGVLHASISGDTGVAASMPDLHQFLQRNDIAVHTLTMRHAESSAPLADTVGRMIGTGSALAQGGNSDAQRQDGAPRRESWEAEKHRESSDREEAEENVQPMRFTKPTTSNANQGSILSIHI